MLTVALTEYQKYKTSIGSSIGSRGWYRVARTIVNHNISRTAFGAGVIFYIDTQYNNTATNDYIIAYTSGWKNPNFAVIAKNIGAYQIFDKIRYVYDQENMMGYIEIHYLPNVINAVSFQFIHPYFMPVDFIKVDDTPTGEILGGEKSI